MLNQNKLTGRDKKISDLVALIKGEINPDDLKPKRLCVYIGYASDNIYAVNEKRVSESEFNKWAKISPEDHGTGHFNITYGEGNDCEFVTNYDEQDENQND